MTAAYAAVVFLTRRRRRLTIGVCENAVDNDVLRFVSCVPNDPLRRVFVTPGSTRRNYFFSL
jgi:hypothetical protein